VLKFVATQGHHAEYWTNNVINLLKDFRFVNVAANVPIMPATWRVNAQELKPELKNSNYLHIWLLFYFTESHWFLCSGMLHQRYFVFKACAGPLFAISKHRRKLPKILLGQSSVVLKTLSSSLRKSYRQNNSKLQNFRKKTLIQESLVLRLRL